MNYRSEYGEDRWIDEHVKLPAAGTYVDIGCGDPEINSNTYFLRQRGWHGLMIDANPDLEQFREGLKNKWAALEIAILSSNDEERFLRVPDNPNLSRISEHGQPAKCRRLADFLREHKIGKIDFLSIDIEGAEFDVMRELDYKLHAPEIIVAEHATLGLDGKVYNDFRLEDFLNAHYRTLHQTVANTIYLRLG